MRCNRRAWSTIVVGMVVTLAALLQPATASASHDRPSVLAAMTTRTGGRSPVVRVNQVGYVTSAPKVAFVNFALGANGWGSSFVVGAGTVFPHCMQSEIANLAGSLTGTGNIQLGATTDGPSAPANFTGLGTVPGMRACSAGDFAPYDTKTAAYQDNVVSWPSVEPADDYAAGSLLAFAVGAAGLG